MRKNTRVRQTPVFTHEGAPAVRQGAEENLRRSVMTCMLWEDNFYEDGQSVADRIAELVTQVPGEVASRIALEARFEQKLRHAPLWIVRAMARMQYERPGIISETLSKVIGRADELSEFLALYWMDGRQPISKQVRKGLAQAFQKFDAYQLKKYDRDGLVNLRDVLFMVHAKPKDRQQATMWKHFVDGTLPSADTWEHSQSAGTGKKTVEDKRERWERLLKENRLGGMAFLRNLRNMTEAGVDESLIQHGFRTVNFKKVLPFRFISAANHVHGWNDEIEQAMFRAVAEMPKLPGKTDLLIDVSGSMNQALSSQSELNRLDTAKAFAILARELTERSNVYVFHSQIETVPNLRGFGLSKAIGRARGWTDLGAAVEHLNQTSNADRLIVITDEQSGTSVPTPNNPSYLVNVATYEYGIGYGRNWTHINGWSENILKYIQEVEK